MAKLMYDAPGVGLAATQVGVQKRIIVFDVGDDRSPSPCATRSSSSAPTRPRSTTRAACRCPASPCRSSARATVVCEGVDLDGEAVRIEADALLARVLQHETDHLDGVLILDRATPEERKAAIRRYLEALDDETAS